MLSVQIDGTLDSYITEDVAVCKVLCNDTGSWLLLLSNLIAVALGVGSEVASVILVGASCGSDLNLGRTELGCEKSLCAFETSIESRCIWGRTEVTYCYRAEGQSLPRFPFRRLRSRSW